MSEPTIPDYANLLRRAAANHAADATRYANTEQHLTTELGKFEEWMKGQRARIQAELDEAQRKADEQLRAIAADWETRKRDLAEAGRVKAEHQKHATGAERAWRNWCHDEGINPADLPPLRDTGPLPAIPAPANGTTTGSTQVLKEFPTMPPADPLPALETPDALPEAGRRAANPAGDPNATQADGLHTDCAACGTGTTDTHGDHALQLPGGDGPGRPFPGDVESPAEPRPKRPTRRRPQSDRVNDQDGDDRG